MPTLPPLQLRRGEERRLRAGHLWVFSNEVDTAATPLKEFLPGDPVMLVDHRGRPLGTGYVNPNSLICARLVDRGGHLLDRSLIGHRLNIALSLRERLYPEPCYRLVFGESDGLPGLVIDRFDDVLVAQVTTAGMERVKDEIVAALVKILSPRAIVWKNEGTMRELEGLPEYADIGYGMHAGPLHVREGGLDFAADAIGGQKTGWFYDQRGNRDALAPFVPGARVLDLFAYVGAWGLRAAAMGAAAVTCVDGSADAVDRIQENARANGLGAGVEPVRADAFEFLKQARADRRHWDVVIVDPPAFVKRRKDLKEGALAYRRLNEMAMQVLSRDGMLFTCSCSHHMPRSLLLEAVQHGARHLDRFAQSLMALQQGPDHPAHPAIPETDYLKGYALRILPA
ncbi:MAG TPA: class I SAM-dependent rRNA methyltransferase [Xanthomonadaceae bacterium]|nr:class I SAM-dependent rRNA methyltransferase [Xanthomonadaceae bacterium]